MGDVAWGQVTERVKKLVVEAYVRGALVGCAENAEVAESRLGVAPENCDG